MYLFLRILNLQLLIFYMNGQEFLTILDYVILCLLLYYNQNLTFLYSFITLLRLIFYFLQFRSLLIPYTYVSIESFDCILLSPFKLKAILLIFSVKTLCLFLKIFFVFLILFNYFLRSLFDLSVYLSCF